MIIRELRDDVILADSADIIPIIRSIIADEEEHDQLKEHLWSAGVSLEGRLIFVDLAALGTMESAGTTIYSIMNPPLKRDNCKRVILIHNHPSRTADPSPADIDFTGKTIQMCRHIYVELWDHLILTSSGYFSFKESGLLIKVEQWATRDDMVKIREDMTCIEENVRDLKARLLLAEPIKGGL